jgi:hypothetical protein
VILSFPLPTLEVSLWPTSFNIDSYSEDCEAIVVEVQREILVPFEPS